MSDTLTIIRNITTDECPWLGYDIPAGAQVEIFYGVTYGCISPAGIAVTQIGGGPFFEIPRDSFVRNLDSTEWMR